MANIWSVLRFPVTERLISNTVRQQLNGFIGHMEECEVIATGDLKEVADSNNIHNSLEGVREDDIVTGDLKEAADSNSMHDTLEGVGEDGTVADICNVIAASSAKLQDMIGQQFNNSKKNQIRRFAL